MALRGVPTYTEPRPSPSDERRLDKVFLAILLGPTIGAARSCVMVGMDSLETRVWGLRNDVTLKSTVSDDSNRESNSFESHHLHGSSEDDAGVAGDSDHQTDSETEDLSETEDADTGESLDQSPPPSRSPSPSSLSTTSNSSSLRHHSPCSPSNRRPQRDHEEAEFSMRAAERLLSRTLASACAEDDEGRSLASEISTWLPQLVKTLLTLIFSRRSDTNSYTPPSPPPLCTSRLDTTPKSIFITRWLP